MLNLELKHVVYPTLRSCVGPLRAGSLRLVCRRLGRVVVLNFLSRVGAHSLTTFQLSGVRKSNRYRYASFNDFPDVKAHIGEGCRIEAISFKNFRWNCSK